MTDFSPREIVSELDRHIVGQREAKRAVAIALRNRWRRKQLEAGLREEVMPKSDSSGTTDAAGHSGRRTVHGMVVTRFGGSSLWASTDART